MGSPSSWPSPKKPPLPPGGIDIAPPSPTPPKRCNPNIPVLSSFLCVFFSDSGDWWDIQLPWLIANANGLTGHFATSYLHNVHDTLFVFATSYFHNPSSSTHAKYSVLEGENMIKRGWGAWQLLQQEKNIWNTFVFSWKTEWIRLKVDQPPSRPEERDFSLQCLFCPCFFK